MNRVAADRPIAAAKCGTCGAALLSSKVATLDPAVHDKASRNDKVPLLVDYWAPWCGLPVVRAEFQGRRAACR